MASFTKTASANERLAHMCSEHGDNVLLPLGSVNPTLPAWEDDIYRCRETFHMRGIRIHPTYHGYTLDDPRFAKLLQHAVDANLVVQIVAGLDDKQHRWLSPPSNALDFAPLLKVASQLAKLRLLISGVQQATLSSAASQAMELRQACVEFSSSTPPADLQRLLENVPPDRFTIGSRAPLHDALNARNLIASPLMTPRERQFITHSSAERLIAGDH